jgi:ethanolamine utilization protein EutA (predicted chaperonin)
MHNDAITKAGGMQKRIFARTQIDSARDFNEGNLNNNRKDNNHSVVQGKYENTADLQEILERLSSLNEFNQRISLNKPTIIVTANKANKANPATLAKQQKPYTLNSTA